MPIPTFVAEQIYGYGQRWAAIESDNEGWNELTDNQLHRMRANCISEALLEWDKIEAKEIIECLDDGLKDGGFPMERIF